jgi:hypothetical protein
MRFTLLLSRYLARRDRWAFGRSLNRLFAMLPVPPIGNVPLTLATISILVLAAAGITLHDWNAAAALNYTYGGWYPINDASKWWSCAEGLARAGAVAGFHSSEFCQMRPIYPGLLASLAGLVRGDTLWLLIAQSALVAVAASWFLGAMLRLAGYAGAAAAALLTLLYLGNFAFSQLMTENAGLAFGLTGLTLLLQGADAGRRRWIVLGAAGLSIGLTARAGAMFALPLLAVWSGFWARDRHRPVASMLLLVAGACCAGPVLQATLELATGGRLASSGGDFAYTLYGLVTGGRGWTAVLDDHPELKSGTLSETTRQIYGFAWAQFRAHPLLLVQGWLDGFTRWCGPALAEAPRPVLTLGRRVLFVAGLWALWRRRRSGSGQVLAVLFLAEALSAGWVYRDAGTRAMAATAGVDIAIDALGAQLLARAGLALLCRLPPYEAGEPRSVRGPAAMLAALTFLVLAPILRIPALLLPPLPAPAQCDGGLEPFVLDVRRSFVLQKTPAGGRFEPLVVAPADRLSAQARLGAAWWSDRFPGDWPDGTALLLTATVDQGADTADRVALLWIEAPPLARADRVELCAETETLPDYPLFGLRRVVSGRVVPPESRP